MGVEQRYQVSGDCINLVKIPDQEVLLTKIPTEVYIYQVEESMMGINRYLEKSAKFTLPSKLYGNVNRDVHRVTKSFENIQDKNLGVLLHGVSGAGKSILAKAICLKMLENDVPVVIVTKNTVEHLNWLIENVNQPLVFFLDEYEKMFEEIEDQNFLLSLMDGIATSHHLFLLTANDSRRVCEYMFNRPSRIRYCYEYLGLSADIVEEFLEDNINNKSRVKEVLNSILVAKSITYDLLAQICNEVNIFDDLSVREILQGFNIELPTFLTNFQLRIVNDKGDDFVGALMKPNEYAYLRVDEDLDISDLRDRKSINVACWLTGSLLKLGAFDLAIGIQQVENLRVEDGVFKVDGILYPRTTNADILDRLEETKFEKVTLEFSRGANKSSLL